MNNLIPVDYFDLVMIRSCQMGCEGCCTFSDHKKIKGLIDVSDVEEAVAFWAKRLKPKRVHLFGGEPLMHPQFMDWFRLAAKYFPKDLDDGKRFPIWLNTNGYYLDKLFDHIQELFVDNFLFVSVTHHTLDEPYASLVMNNFDTLKTLVADAYNKKYAGQDWQWEVGSPWDTPSKIFHRLVNSQGHCYILINMTHQYDDHFVSHYRGHGETLKPWHDYNHDEKLYDNHRMCHITNYVQLYDNRLWKCPPRGVLNQTLEAYNLTEDPDWAPYYNEYESLGLDASEEKIATWFERQRLPEKTCNMCGFMYSDNQLIPAQQHLPKKLFKLKPA